MNIRVDHYFHSVGDSHSREILAKLDLLLERIAQVNTELDRLTSAVEQNTTVDQSVIALVNGLAQQLRDMATAATDLAALKASVNTLAGNLEASNQTVADAIAANTPTPPTI